MDTDGIGGAIRGAPERAMRSALLALSQRRVLGRVATATPLTRPFVERFVAGQSLAEALPRLRQLVDAGFHSTVDVLGESVRSADAATAAVDRYLAALDALAAGGLDRNVSVKLSQMGLAIDHELALRNAGRIVEHAAGLDGFVRIDMEDSSTTDATLAIQRDLWSAHRNVGVVIQAALRRSASDLDVLIASGVRVRLCKGAYKEPPSVAFASRADVDESYSALMTRLLREGTYPALATHDERLIRRAINVARQDRIGGERFEFQMLYGVRRDLQERLVKAGYTVRIYVPFGREWYPYFMRRLAERPANVAFVVRSVLGEPPRLRPHGAAPASPAPRTP
jgi:proline dehydrogenase